MIAGTLYHALALAGLLLLPGWALLALSGLWRTYPGLQGWCLAVGLSIACFPTFFYTLRAVAPTLRLGPVAIALMLAGCGLLAAWQLRRDWRAILRFDRFELLALAIFGITILTRLLVIVAEPFPAWSDSLHHTLLTRLTIDQGQLPHSLEPYLPIYLGQYHLGLYALSASLAWITGLPAHSALLLIAQVLNGLCGLGVYLVLDRRCGRVAALVGAVVVGLITHQPAWYVNWGRFTQLASQTLLPIGWLLTWEALERWRTAAKPWPGQIWICVLASLLNAAIALLHFRVITLYLPLLALTFLVELWQGRRLAVIGATASIAGLALLISLPALWEALLVYLNPPPITIPITTASRAIGVRSYFDLSLESVPMLAAHTWLLGLGAVALLVGVFTRHQLTLLLAGWSGALLGSGLLYLTNIPALSFINLSGVLILTYIPLSLMLGGAAGELLRLSGPRRPLLQRGLLSLICAGGLLAAPQRVRDREPFRYFVTPADVQAMEWIRANTPRDARFAINTTFWLPIAPYGTDGGYWITYFTDRHTTSGVMINTLGPSDYLAAIVEQSQLVEQIGSDPGALTALRRMGVGYIYIGPRGDFSGDGLDPAQLRATPGLALVYDHAGVNIFQIAPDPASS